MDVNLTDQVMTNPKVGKPFLNFIQVTIISKGFFLSPSDIPLEDVLKVETIILYITWYDNYLLDLLSTRGELFLDLSFEGVYVWSRLCITDLQLQYLFLKGASLEKLQN